MTLAIPLTIQIAGVYADADTTPTVTSVTPSATYVVTHDGTGLYSVTLADAVAGTTYVVVGTATVNGVAYGYTKSATAATTETLTSLATVKSYMGISDTSQDAKLTMLLTAATQAIENYCDRVFASESMVDYFDGKHDWRHGFVHLKRMPVTSISRIATEPFQVLTVKHESDSVQIATVQVTTTGVTLVATASAVATTTALTFAAYPTLAEMASAIAAAGFTATVASGYDYWPSAYLRIPQGALNAKAGGLTNGAWLYTYIRDLSVARIDYDEGTIYGYFPEGVSETEVRYTAGYATIPSDVQTACCMVVKGMNDASKIDGNLAYEKLGDYSWGRRTDSELSPTTAIMADAIPLLAKYRRVRAM
jgi:hypothetical protein